MRYHANAVTNIKQRELIQQSQLPFRTLSSQYQVSLGTIHRWKHAASPEDRQSTPQTIHYALNVYEQQLICGVRQMEWVGLDDLVLLLEPVVPKITRSNTYRTLKRVDLNRKPEPEGQGKGRFKKYDPGYVHMDVFYLPKLNGKRAYVFVAIDRVTKMMFLEVYGSKRKESALDFLKKCLAFFPFNIHTILTDNGREFTLKGLRNKYGQRIKPKKQHVFTALCQKNRINHKTTKIKHPWTNGQVERVNGILEERTIKRYQYQNHQQIYVHLKQHETHWNYFKKHKTLNLKTIPQILEEWYKKKPEIFRVPFDQLPFTML
jgi:transposase-like protein